MYLKYFGKYPEQDPHHRVTDPDLATDAEPAPDPDPARCISAFQDIHNKYVF
jgi:hypothetical protein